DWVFHLPNLSGSRRAELKALKIDSISAIPNNFRLSPRQRIIRGAAQSGKVFVAPDLFERLNSFGPPAFSLDFEAFAPSVPSLPATRPVQTVPFQWSLHQINADGSVSHQEFLSEADTDPRRPFARTLI